MRELFLYRDFIIYKFWADLRSEARRFYISYIWWFLDPILYMLVFYLVFGILLSRQRPDFVPFLLIGLASWRWFGTSVQHAAASILQAKGLMLQTYIPKAVFPAIVILTDIFKFILIFFVLLIFLWSYGFGVDYYYLALPIVIATQLSFILFIGFSCSVVVPFLPDLNFLIGHVIHLMFFVSGVFFGIDAIPEKLRIIFLLNPMARILQSYREILMYKTWPDMRMLLIISAISLVGCACALMLLRRFDRVYPRVIE